VITRYGRQENGYATEYNSRTGNGNTCILDTEFVRVDSIINTTS